MRMPIGCLSSRIKTKGNAERFIHTLCREWAYARPFQNSEEWNCKLPRYLAIYNRLRE